MSSSLLFLSRLILHLSPINFFFTSLLSSLVSLCDNQLGVDNLFILFLLALHYFELCLLKNLHSSLFQSLTAKNIEHWLNLLVEIKKLMVSFKYLSCLTAVLRGHFWSKERHGRPVKIEFSSNTLLPFWWLISKNLLVWVCLYVNVQTARDWLRCWNITIWINISSLFCCLKFIRGLVVTYTSLSKCSWLRLVLIHYHVIWISTGWDNHSSVSASSLNPSVMHDVLREILSIKHRRLSICQPYLFFKFQISGSKSETEKG